VYDAPGNSRDERSIHIAIVTLSYEDRKWEYDFDKNAVTERTID